MSSPGGCMVCCPEVILHRASSLRSQAGWVCLPLARPRDLSHPMGCSQSHAWGGLKSLVQVALPWCPRQPSMNQTFTRELSGLWDRTRGQAHAPRVLAPEA